MTLPPLFLNRLKGILPAGTDIGGYFKVPPQAAFRVNTLKVQPQEIARVLAQEDIPCAWVPWYGPAFTVGRELAGRVLDSELYSGGKVYAQGLSSMLPVIALDPQPGETVLDLCAAPGSKTTQIAAHMNNEGTLIANEPVRGRFYRLKAVAELLGARVRLTMKDGRYLRHEAVFDRILVDAPCSSEGRFLVDDPKTYAYWSLRKIHEMAHKQKGLLLNAGRLLKPGGVLVYATCTFAPEENEAVVDWFLRKTPGEFILEKSQRVLPDGSMEGFFLAKFTRIQ